MICFSVETNTFLSACPQVACHAQENERQTINATVLIGLNKIPDSSGTTISPSSEIKKCPDFLAEIPRTRSKLSMRFSSLSPIGKRKRYKSPDGNSWQCCSVESVGCTK